MKLGVFTALFGQQSLDEALDYIKKVGVEVVEKHLVGSQIFYYDDNIFIFYVSPKKS